MGNISEIQTGFIDYLINKYGEDVSEKIDSYSPELSIFMYSSDFQQYLVGNGYADVSIFTQSISEIKEMLTSGETENSGEMNDDNIESEQGNFLTDSFIATALTDAFNSDTDLFDSVNTNSNATIDIEEITAFLDSVDAIMKENPSSFETIFDGIAKGIQDIIGAAEEAQIDRVLDSIYSSEEALEYLDIDGDGQISDFEKELFESYVQGDKEELSSEDLEKALQDMKNGTYQYDVKLPEDAIPVQDIPETVASESPASSDNISARQTSNPTQSLTSTGRSYSSGGSSLTTAKDTSPTDINDMNLEQLKKEQSNRQTNADNAKENVDTILSDIDEIEGGKYKDAREAYDEAVENDENISDELKEKREDNLNAIEEKNGEIDSLNSQIAETEVSLNDANDKLDGDTKTLSSLKSALSSYDGVSSDDPDEQRKIDQAKQELQAQIDELENTTIPADEEECKRLEELLNGGGSTEGLKDQLKTKEEELDKLNEEKDEIEQEILEVCKNDPNSPVVKALEEFKAVEQELNELRDKLPTAQEELTTALDDLSEVNELIRTKEAEETESEKSHYSGSLPDELVAELDAKLGSGFCAKLEEVAKNINCDPKDLIGMMQSESGINPSAYNNNGGATGLIQFMPSTARSLGTTTQELLNMSAIEQLDYVEQYFTNWTGGSGQRLTGGDLYTLCFLPAFLDREVLCSSSDSSTSKYYSANSGLDANGDGSITKSELSNRVANKYQEVLAKYGLS